VAIAYAARCYLRLSSLLPHLNDLKQVGRDVEDLATTMASCESVPAIPAEMLDPGLQVSEHLRDVVTKARRSRVLPPSTEPSSPHLVPSFGDGSAGFQLFNDVNFDLLNMQPANDEVLGADFEWNQGWDFSLVDQLFSTVTGPGNDVGHTGPAFWDR